MARPRGGGGGCASSAAPQDLHWRSSGGSAEFLGTRMRSCSPPASMPMAGCSRRCSGPEDAVISDALNHASIIDGIRLCKARRYRYANNDMADLEKRLHRIRAPAAADRDRRRVLDGRHHRPSAGDLRARGASRRHGHGGRQPRGRGHGPSGARHARSTAASRTRSTSSPARSARRWAARPGGYVAGRARRLSTCCGSGRGLISSPIRCRRRSAPSNADGARPAGGRPSLLERVHANAAVFPRRDGGGFQLVGARSSDRAGDDRGRPACHPNGVAGSDRSASS